jgi:hypothetical protein
MAGTDRLAINMSFDACRRSGCPFWYCPGSIGIWEEKRMFYTFKERLCSIFLNRE